MMIYGYIATTIDGYIADEQGNIDFLNDFQTIDCGYDHFIEKIDTIVMGRKTYEAICAFGIDWPYPNQKTWIVTSQTDLKITDANVEIWQGDLSTLMSSVQSEQDKNCWILGGGELISSVIALGYMDQLEVYITPVLLGSGIPLFTQQNYSSIKIQKVESNLIGNTITQQIYTF